ncbi:GmrSD restriction endonuclease domain-containing protein [Geodermatophilus sp. URMC 61]|uniref:GmrSD restriction endonuclease domain-containing protein n=1 Tax=Geodermatophilus sp. URMC 61 TaxID=3423411 RepID=UPI00406C7F45
MDQHEADLFQTNPESVTTLLLEVAQGKLALPQFQRDFIWAPANTASLLSSIMAKYPAGALLFWRPEGQLLDARPVANAPALPANRLPDRLILDGQQRLTALYRALNRKTEESYFVAIDALVDMESYELLPSEVINWDSVVVAQELTARERRGLKKTQPEQPEHRSLKWQHKHFRFPLGDKFDDWMDELVEEADTKAERKRRQGTLREVRDRYLDQLKNYRFPVITLTGAASVAAVCNVFEKLNTNSIRLGPFEILTAKFYSDGVNLRDYWDTAKANHSVLRDPNLENDHGGFSIDPYLVLQILTLVKHGSPQRNAVLNKLRAKDVEEGWDDVILALKRSIEWLRDNCGIIHRDILPYQAILVPFAGAWLFRESLLGEKKAQAIKKIEQYFWASVFTSNFDQGAASQSEKDYKDLIAWLVNEERGGVPIEPEAIGTLTIKADDILAATVKKKALLQALMALSVKAGAKDFHKGEPLTPSTYIENKVNSHHLYPKARLNDTNPATRIDNGGYSPELILNRALIDAETNRRIGAKKPSLYLQAMQEASSDVDALLDSHLASAEALAADDYAAFLLDRLRTVVDQIESVTGRPVAPLTVKEGEADDQPASDQA